MKKTVAIDIDGVLADYSEGWKGVDNIGRPIAGAVAFVAAVSEFADVVLHSSRTNPELNKPEAVHLLVNRVRSWADRNGFKYADIWAGTGKPIAAAYVDDRAVICRPQKDDSYDYDRALAEVRALCQGKPLGGQGEYSRGKLDDEDQGDLRMAVGRQGGNVRIDFGKPVAWLAFPPDEAVQLAMLILKHSGAMIQ